MTEQKFKQFIWDNKAYFENIYENNPLFFKPKGNNGSDSYYIDDEAIFKWVNMILDKYDPFDENKKTLENELLAKRVQYSNGTLFSSSRFVAELFRTRENRSKLLRFLNIDLEPEDFKWTLEYRLPIKNLPLPAKMDLVVENDSYFIAIESKMKEIYKNWDAIFSLSYQNENNSYLQEFNYFLNIDFKNHTVVKRYDNKIKGYKNIEVHKASIKGFEKSNFDYKQQICHLLSIRNKQENDNLPNKKYIFMNLVFDSREIDKNENEQILKYLKNEEGIIKLLKPHFDKTNIEYKGVINQLIKPIN